MLRDYSRRARFEEKRNVQRAVFISLITITLVVILILYGVPIVVKYAGFLTDINGSSREIKVDDETPPPPPRLDTIAQFTNQPKLDINGTSEPGSTVVVMHNHSEKEVLANKSGRFSISIDLRDGKNTISAYAKDTHGNKSNETEEISIEYDTTPPDLTISSPENNAQFYGSLKRQISIQGTTEKEASVSVNGRFVILGNEGNFSYIVSLTEGKNDFTIKAEDKAGNATETTLSVTYSQ